VRSRSGKRLPNWAIGLLMILVLAVASYVAFTKQVPWGGGTEVTAVFNSAQNLRTNSPVRIAGVEVGKVTKVEPLASAETGGTASDDSEEAAAGTVQTGAVVTMELDDEALPIKEDATFSLRPRLFLEGNLFVDVRPGSPSAPDADLDTPFPATQTQNYVQLDEILTGSLQSDARKDLQILLDQFGTALIDEGGAKSLQELNRVSPGAFKNTSIVNDALLGENPHDLSELIRNLDSVVRGLGANEGELQDLVTNLRITTGSFAQQSAPLEAAIQELPNTLDAGQTAFTSLNASFPPLRAFSREILPGVRSTPEMLEAATPLLRQLRGLAQPSELRGLVAQLRPTVPDLALLTDRTIPFLRQARALSSCFNHTILPWANDTVDGGAAYNSSHPPQGRVFEETGYGLAGISGESRSGDANGQYIRVIGGGGTNTVVTQDGPNPVAGVTPFPLEGAMPAVESSAKTPFEPDEPCELQDPPNLSAVGGPPPSNQSTLDPGAMPTSGEAGDIVADAEKALTGLGEAALAEEEGDELEAAELQEQAMKDLQDFYEEHGG
jgi:phospholipid/cholesterol/gamma-HCH transport system substrate-binding protein